MSDDKYLLSISTGLDGDEVNIHTDKAGLTYLAVRIDSLRRFLTKGDCPIVIVLGR